MDKQLLFQPSSAFNPIGIALYVLLMTLTTVGLGYIYSLLIIFFPLIYVNVFITIGYGLSVAYLSLLYFRVTRVQDPNSKVGLTIFAGVAASLFAWITYLLYALDISYPPFATYLQFIPTGLNPGVFFPLLAEINEVGLWEIGGIVFNGWLVTAVWVIELAIIIGFPLLVLKRSKPMPYSDTFGKWYPCFTLQENFNAVYNPDRIIAELADNPVQKLGEIVGGGAIHHAKAHLFYIPEERTQYLTLENFKLQRGKETSWKSDIAVNALRISTEDAQALKKKYGWKRNPWQLF